MAFQTVYHEDSDADDEYERSLVSPVRADSEASPSDSESVSENTPTTHGKWQDDHELPRTIISEWTVDECADFMAGLGLGQYAQAFVDNEIVGEALIALKHDELKEMGIASVGHRLTILKSVYDIKVEQDIPIEPEHYIPLSAEGGSRETTATQEDVQRILQQIRLRDARIQYAEAELKKIAEEYRKLREELLPVFRMAKDRSQPLPHIAADHGMDGSTNPAFQERAASSLSRKFSTKKLFLNSAPKNGSPTHLPSPGQDKGFGDSSTLDPSAAAMAASNHLTASTMGESQSTPPYHPKIPSPSSPPVNQPSQPPLNSRAYSRDQVPPSARSPYGAHPEDVSNVPHASYTSTTSTLVPDRDRSNPTPTGGRRDGAGTADTGSGGPSVEIFKSFRVSMDDPCYKVLPAALKKYNITADWRQYALYIVHGDQERCLGMDERPLILFKQLDREGRKPMFMLRKTGAPVDAHPGMSGQGSQPNSAGLEGRGGTPYSGGIQLPGGVL